MCRRSLIFSPTQQKKKRNNWKKKEINDIQHLSLFSIQLLCRLDFFVFVFSIFVVIIIIIIVTIIITTFFFFAFSSWFWPRLSVKRNSFCFNFSLSFFSVVENLATLFDKVNHTYIYLFIVIKWANVERAEFKIVNSTIKSMGMAEWTILRF